MHHYYHYYYNCSCTIHCPWASVDARPFHVTATIWKNISWGPDMYAKLPKVANVNHNSYSTVEVIVRVLTLD